MKRYLHRLILAASLCGGCNKQLDLKPENTMVEADLLKHELTAEGFLADTYRQLLGACSGNAYMLPDFSAGTVAELSNVLLSGNIDPRDKNYYGLWDQPYKTINQANVIIERLHRYAAFDRARQDEFIAEARFIRAFAYLQLLEMYGDGALQGKMNNAGVPLRLQPFDGYDGSQNIPRSTNGAVYTQIIKDLDAAIAVLPDNRKTPVLQSSRATKRSAGALAARVSLYRQQYDKALAYANAVMAGNRYQLEDSIGALWPNNAAGTGKYPVSKEMIFCFPESYNATSKYNENHGIYWSYYKLVPAFTATYHPDDERNKNIMVAGKFNPVMRKFSDPNLRDNVCMLRLPEVMLTAAEAQVRLHGVNESAVALLNTIYKRAFAQSAVPKVYTVADFPSPEALIARIVQERLWELAYEGFARYDAIRHNKAPNPLLPPDKFALPVPQREIDITNGLIRQNPGYK